MAIGQRANILVMGQPSSNYLPSYRRQRVLATIIHPTTRNRTPKTAMMAVTTQDSMIKLSGAGISDDPGPLSTYNEAFEVRYREWTMIYLTLPMNVFAQHVYLVAILPLLTEFSEMPWTADCEYHVDIVLECCLVIVMWLEMVFLYYNRGQKLFYPFINGYTVGLFPIWICLYMALVYVPRTVRIVWTSTFVDEKELPLPAWLMISELVITYFLLASLCLYVCLTTRITLKNIKLKEDGDTEVRDQERMDGAPKDLEKENAVDLDGTSRDLEKGVRLA
ncbi:Protein of unknown function [Pyronema omphalodes CBS 100304]|uniref:Transmembrane protein n=1 Tax=Pyronema omphalodes (strain CBS 100304) TaxID=1076935 RepID=U4LUA4_PYROM|nr:Protein of unknown function [Pyronema omphalodes CBS 100304]